MGKKKKDKIDKETQPEELVGVSSGKIKIRVFKHFGSNISFKKDEYEAIEKRDHYGNLISFNEKRKHNEDVDFTIDDIYREMNIILEFKNLGKEKRLEILKKKITYQEKLLRYLDKFVELNSIFNYADEEIKARDYKILKNYIEKHDSNGAYFRIENGARVYEFESVDGFLVPYWRGVDTYSQYPDHTRKKKIIIQEDKKFDEEMKLFNREKIANAVTLVTMIVTLVVFVITCFMGYTVWEKGNELKQQSVEDIGICKDALDTMTQNYVRVTGTDVFELYKENLKLDLAQKKSELNESNNKIKDLTIK